MSSAARGDGAGRGEVGEARGDPEARGRLLDFIPNAALPTVSPSLPFQSLPHHSSSKSQLQSLFPPLGPPGAALATSDSQEGLPSSGLPRWPPGAAGPQRLTWWELLTGSKVVVG